MFQVQRSFKRIIGGSDPFEEIFYGSPTEETFHQAKLKYDALNRLDKEALIDRCFKKLAKQKKPKEILAILHLIDTMGNISSSQMKTSIAVRLQSLDKLNLIESKDQKGNAAETNFAKFCLKYLQLKLCRDNSIKVNEEATPLNKILEITDSSIQIVSALLQNEFIINYFTNHSGDCSQIAVAISKQILEFTLLEFQFLINFVTKWSLQILNENQFCVAINQVYEKVIRFEKERRKLEALCRKVKSQKSVPHFVFDKKLNSSIEQKMMTKSEERRAFKTEKHINSKKNIAMDEDQIDQDDILMIAD